MSKFVKTNYSNSTEILRVAEYIALPVTVSDEGATTVDGKKIVKAGTILGGKSKSALLNEGELVVKKNTQGGVTGTAGAGVDAEGILLHDVDVTHGANAGALLVQAVVKVSKLAEAPTVDAKKALKSIIFTA